MESGPKLPPIYLFTPESGISLTFPWQSIITIFIVMLQGERPIFLEIGKKAANQIVFFSIISPAISRPISWTK